MTNVVQMTTTMRKLERPKRRILVVDDNPIVSDSVERVLTAEGYEVETADGGRAALARLALDSFDLIITDYVMPVMTGDKVAETIKARNPRQRIIMMTAYPEMLKAAGASLGNIDLVISKPFSASQLTKTVGDLLPART